MSKSQYRRKILEQRLYGIGIILLCAVALCSGMGFEVYPCADPYRS